MTCEHPEFRAQVGVGRLSQVEGGPITHYTAEIAIKCVACGEPFQFLGLPMGSNAYGAATSVDALELRAAIKPQNGPEPPPGLPGFSVKVTTPPGAMQ
ncbi:hypothetical protein [Vitreimonas flagellata]|uniref:hypothetical protein n=1 Tax=Vitreimonas flagellata TaxID=2560861 RepID=UPI001075025A|nr:hypothetical protein [Vitreimonas flagellata]